MSLIISVHPRPVQAKQPWERISCTEFWGREELLGSPAVKPMGVFLHLETGGSSCIKGSPLHLIQLTPNVSSGVRGYCGETTTHWGSIHLIFLCLNVWCDNRESGREFEKQEAKQ